MISNELNDLPVVACLPDAAFICHIDGDDNSDCAVDEAKNCTTYDTRYTTYCNISSEQKYYGAGNEHSQANSFLITELSQNVKRGLV